MGKRVLFFIILMACFRLNAASQLYLPALADSNAIGKKMLLLPRNFYTQHQPFFCKKEDQLQKHTGLNLFFRLGSKKYVDWLEGKPNAKGQ